MPWRQSTGTHSLRLTGIRPSQVKSVGVSEAYLCVSSGIRSGKGDEEDGNRATFQLFMGFDNVKNEESQSARCPRHNPPLVVSGFSPSISFEMLPIVQHHNGAQPRRLQLTRQGSRLNWPSPAWAQYVATNDLEKRLRVLTANLDYHSSLFASSALKVIGLAA